MRQDASASSQSTGFLREASARFGISPGRLETMVRAARLLSRDEMAVVRELLHLADTGATTERRSAVSRGMMRALEALPGEAALDPLAIVDEPLDMADAAESLALGEMEAQGTREAILQDCISVADAAHLIGRSRQALERLRRAGRLLALRVGAQWRYPRWQFDPDAPGGVLPGLAEVLQQLALSPVGAAFWLLQPSEPFGGRPPIELLRRRRAEPVLELAREQSFLP